MPIFVGMELNYVKNQTDDSADIFLFDNIGGFGINAQDFVNELRFLDSQGLSEINVRINSAGGSVIEGFGIFSAIRNADTRVNTIIEGVAASIAGIIAMAGDNRKISDFGRLMIHDPSFGGGTPNGKQKKALDTIKDSLIKVLANNSALDEGEIFDLMSEETWFNADEALAFGFIDEIFSTHRKELKEAKNELTVADIQNAANDLYHKTEVEQTVNKMTELINHFGLNKEATEAEILNEVKDLANKLADTEKALNDANDDHNEEKTKLEETINGLETSTAELKKEVATLVVENAIEAGKFKAENKEALVEKATADLDGFKNIVDSVADVPASIVNTINTAASEEDAKDWDYYQKKDPKGLKNLMATNPDEYKRLFKDKYGVEATI